MAKHLTPKQLNELLQSTRDQKFRTKSENQLLGRAMASAKVKMFYEQNPDAMKVKANKVKQSNLNVYSKGTYIVRSPGNDLLDFYDRMHKEKVEAPKNNITPIPPSRIYQFRYKTELPDVFGANQFSGLTQTDIFRNVCKPYADNFNSQKIAIDKKVLYKWLVDKPSEQTKFKLGSHAVDFLSKIKGSSQRGLKIAVHTKNPVYEQMFWKGTLAGWSVVFIKDED